MENMMLLGIVFADKTPNIQNIFETLVNDLNDLVDPFVLQDFNGRDITCTVRTLAVVLDMQALWQVGEMAPYGECPCGSCPQKKGSTHRICPTKKGRLTKENFPLYTDGQQAPEPGASLPPPHPPYRTAESWMYAAEVAVESRETFMGINGPCALQRLRHFPFPEGLVADNMHSLYEHLVGEHRKYWLDPKFLVRFRSLWIV